MLHFQLISLDYIGLSAPVILNSSSILELIVHNFNNTANVNRPFQCPVMFTTDQLKLAENIVCSAQHLLMEFINKFQAKFVARVMSIKWWTAKQDSSKPSR